MDATEVWSEEPACHDVRPNEDMSNRDDSYHHTVSED